MSAVLASQIIRTELLLQRYQIRRQLEQQRSRSNKLSQPLQSQQRSNQEPGPAAIGPHLRAIQERGSSEPVRPPPGAMRILGSKHRVSRVCRRSVARCAPVIQRGKDSQQRTGSIRATWPRVKPQQPPRQHAAGAHVHGGHFMVLSHFMVLRVQFRQWEVA